ncbi:hypothetical protein ACFL3D_03215 [Candidatus Omnitrophota bacterium]
MAKVAAVKSAWIVVGVVLIIQLMDSCENIAYKIAALIFGALIVALGSWFIVKHGRKG